MKLLKTLLLTCSLLTISACSHFSKHHEKECCKKVKQSCCTDKDSYCVKNGCKEDKSCCEDKCKKCDGKDSCQSKECDKNA